MNHPPLLLAENTPKRIRILFSAYEKLVFEKNHDHELILDLTGTGEIKMSRLVRY